MIGPNVVQYSNDTIRIARCQPVASAGYSVLLVPVEFRPPAIAAALIPIIPVTISPAVVPEAAVPTMPLTVGSEVVGETGTIIALQPVVRPMVVAGPPHTVFVSLVSNLARPPVPTAESEQPAETTRKSREPTEPEPSRPIQSTTVTAISVQLSVLVLVVHGIQTKNGDGHDANQHG